MRGLLRHALQPELRARLYDADTVCHGCPVWCRHADRTARLGQPVALHRGTAQGGAQEALHLGGGGKGGRGAGRWDDAVRLGRREGEVRGYGKCSLGGYPGGGGGV